MCYNPTPKIEMYSLGWFLRFPLPNNENKSCLNELKFVRFPKILYQAFPENFSCEYHDKVRNPHPLYNCSPS